MFASFAWYDRDSSLWKTSQRFLFEGWDAFSEIWPRAGMTRNGIVFQRAPLAPLTDATAFGLLPTPQAVDGLGSELSEVVLVGEGLSISKRSQQKASWFANKKRSASGGALSPSWVEWLMGFPIGWTDCAVSETQLCRKSSSGSDIEF